MQLGAIDSIRWHRTTRSLVYKIPPLKANEGHRANDWGDLGKPLWKGRLRFVEKGETATMKFEDPNTGKLQLSVSLNCSSL